MSPARIRTRTTANGEKRYMVVYRLGGRGFPTLTAGTFTTIREARARRDFVAGEIAAGRDPKSALAQLRDQPQPRSFRQWSDLYKTSRVDLGDKTLRNVDTHLRRLLPAFGDRDPAAITPADVQAFVSEASRDLKPSSLKRYVTTLAQILDHAQVDPNPARGIRLPRIRRAEIAPPSARELIAILDRVTPRWRLPFVTMEQTGMTIGETAALAWGDVDEDGLRFRLRFGTVKGEIRTRARWVQVPDWLMDEISARCPVEDRTPERRVFHGFNDNGARSAIRRACLAAAIPAYSPHDFRHRRISLWHGQGVPAAELAARAGHSRSSMTLDVYSHVMPLDEVPVDRLRAMVVGTR